MTTRPAFYLFLLYTTSLSILKAASGAEISQPTTLQEVSLTSLIVKLVFFLMLLGLACYTLVKISKRGGLARVFSTNRENKLKILETKLLGHKQCLVVVEYGSKQMLLGVTPNTINCLSTLNPPDTLTPSDSIPRHPH